MRLSDYVKLFVIGLSLMILSACGTCPNLRYDGSLKNEHLLLLQERAAEKKIDLTAEEVRTKGLAAEGAFIPLIHSYFRAAGTYEGPVNVTKNDRTGGPYRYSDGSLPMFPLSLWMSGVNKTYSESGEELSRGSFKALVVGLLASWGGFRYESRERVPAKMSGTLIMTGLGALVAPFYPTRWYFTGTEGHYWNGPLWLFGHVSSETSSTFHLLGFIPIRYRNSEKPGNI